MNPVQNLRELINERLTAAAEEIFTEFEKTIVQYEEEIDRQRKLLDNIWKPEIILHTTDLVQQHVQEEIVLAEQNVCNQERNSSLDQDPEPPLKNEEQEELCTSQEGEQLVLMQEADALVQWNSNCVEISREIFQVSDEPHDQLEEDIDYQRRLVDMIWKPRIILHRIAHQHQDVCKEENVLGDQQLRNQENKFRLDKKETEPPQIKEEQEELCISQQGNQIVMKQATDTFPSTSTDMDNDLSDLRPNSNRHLFFNSPGTKTPHLDRSKLVASCSTRNATPKPRSHIKKHHQIHKGVKPNACNTCRKNFSSWSQLKVHMKLHTGEKMYSCEICGKHFTRGSYLTVHKRTHTGERPFSCETCGKGFSERGKLTVHMRVHTGEKPFSCERCGKNFSQRGQLTVHMRAHTGERPHSCETCGKGFSRAGHLTVHKRIHTGERPFSCEICKKSFSERSKLTVHMRTHTGEKPYSCETCGKGFNKRSKLTLHMLAHTTEMLHLCKS